MRNKNISNPLSEALSEHSSKTSHRCGMASCSYIVRHETNVDRFTWCMNAGIISILLHQLPYQFSGLGVLSTIAFVVELVLFVIFSLIFVLRFVWFKGQALSEVTGNVQDLSFLAAWPIAFLLLAALVGLIVSPAYWGGQAFSIVAFVMWWVGAGWMVLTYMFIFIKMTRMQSASPEAGGRLPPLILYPAMGIATVATTGGLISAYSVNMSARLAVPIMIFSLLMAGLAIFTALMLYPLLMFQFFSEGFPPAAVTPAMFVHIGPLGQAAAALQLVGSAASTYGRFAAYGRGPFLSGMSASAFNTACVLIAFLCAGMAIMWLFLAVYVMLQRAFEKQMSWSLTWNSIIFPIGTLTTAFNAFGIQLNSPTFNVLNTALVLIMVTMFFVNLAFTTLKVAKGELLIVKEDPRTKKEE